MSLRDRILAANDIESKVFHVAQWGIDIELRTLSASDRAQLVSSCMSADGTVDIQKMYPSLIIACVYDPETGGRVFSIEDMDAISDKSASAVEFVAQKAMEMSGMKPDAIDEEGKGN